MLADLIGKGGDICNVSVPGWVKTAVDALTTSAGLQEGVLFRPVGKTGKVRGSGLTAKVIWSSAKR